MSAETQILDQLKTDLLYIKSANSYTNNLKDAVEGYRPLSATNDFDCAYFFMGIRKPLKFTSDNKHLIWQGELWIMIQFKARDISLSRAVESWVEDFRKWLYQSSAVTAGKYYTLDTSLPAVVSWNAKELQDIVPYNIWEEHIAELTFKININYST